MTEEVTVFTSTSEVRMRLALLHTFVALAVIPTVAAAQEWSPAQKEVWAAETACWTGRTMETFEGCFHPAFVGWGTGTVPTTKADRRPFFDQEFATNDLVFQYLKPIAITLHGDMAALLYVATYTIRNKKSGAETTFTERWTDIMVKEGGRWSWIADHGATLPNQ